MEEQLKEAVSESLEIDKDILDLTPYLLQDLWALGSSIGQIIEAVGNLDINHMNTKVLDLGCGKGAISIKLASLFDHHVIGIDGMKSFLNAAEKRAIEFNVIEKCNFLYDDILAYTEKSHDFDIVIFASIGGLFGSWKETITRLRSQVKNGGYIIIDDGYLTSKNRYMRKGYYHYRDHTTTLWELLSYGDELVEEINTSEITNHINLEYLHLIEKRANELITKNPEQKEKLKNYINQQAEECAIIDCEICGTLWVIRKI